MTWDDPAMNAMLKAAGVDFGEPASADELARRHGLFQGDSAEALESAIHVVQQIIGEFEERLKNNVPAWVTFVDMHHDKKFAASFRDAHNRYVQIMLDQHKEHLRVMLEKRNAFDGIMKDIFENG